MNDRPVSNLGFEMMEGHSRLVRGDRVSMLAALFLLAIVGLDLYGWLVMHKAPHMSIAWFPAAAVNVIRRATSSDVDPWQWPVSWARAFGVYSLVVLAVVLFKQPAGWDDWVLAGSAAAFATVFLWKATAGKGQRS